MSDYVSKHCEPCKNGNNTTIDATKYCVACEESYCDSCSMAHKTQKATRNHVLTDIEHYFENTEPLVPSTECEPCSENGITVTAVSRCLECKESYCENCARIHKSQKATRNHEVKDLEIENERSVCEACSYDGVEDRPASALCITCDEALCLDCTKVHKSQKATRSHQIGDNQNTNTQPPAHETDQSSSTKTHCCDHCKDKKRVTVLDEMFWFCFNCRQALCETCTIEHKKAPEASNHRIIQSTDQTNGNEVQTNSTFGSESSSADSIPEEITDPDRNKGCDCCAMSDDENIAGFCLDCKVQLCPACVTEHGQVEDTKSHRLLLNEPKQRDHTMQDEKQVKDSETRTVKSDTGGKEMATVVKDLCQLCQEQGLESPVVAFCFDCLQTLCEQCTIKHTEDQATKLHKIMRRSDENQYSNKKADDNKAEVMSKQEENDKDMSGTQPGKPAQVGALKVDSVTITWSAPKQLYDAYCYQTRYKEDKYDAKWQYYDEDKTQNTSLTVRNLKSHSCFILQVRMVNNEGEGPYSEASDSIETLPSASELVFGLSHEVSDLGCQLKLRQFRLNENTAARNSQLKTRKLMLGDDKTYSRKEKTVLLLGASGTGKTTFVNGLVNYLFGVTFADGFRFTIVNAEEDETYAVTTNTRTVPPKTQWITCYSVSPVKGSKIDYKLTVIDTPGFGDRGIQRDAEIKQQLKELFSAVDEKGILFVDAVCIFMKASEARLTVTQEYIYTTITSLFHRDIQENICSVVTFSDGKAPPVLSALKEANLPHETYFPFNTTEVFSDNLQTSHTSLTKVFYEMNISSFAEFTKTLATLKTKSLSQSNEVLEKRKQIEETSEILLSKVGIGLNKMEDCRAEIAILEKFKTQMTANKDFKYTRKKHVQKLIPLEKGKHTTNCLHCNVTCHENCAYANDEDKAKCVAMDGNGYCRRCEDHCFWKEHKNTPFIIEWVQVEEEGTYDEMMQKYQKASDEVVTHEAVVAKMKKELDEVETEMLDLMKKIADCSNQLSQIALRANPLSVTEHIDILIENEKLERKPGFQGRINNLDKLKKRITVGEEFEQFQKSKEDIYK